MKDAPKLGEPIEGDAFRDAVHVAVAPVEAGTDLRPGERVGLGPCGRAFARDRDAVGVVDPFLPGPVRAGQKFWLCLYPGTVTSLRHAWTHPAFRPKAPEGGVLRE